MGYFLVRSSCKKQWHGTYDTILKPVMINCFCKMVYQRKNAKLFFQPIQLLELPTIVNHHDVLM